MEFIVYCNLCDVAFDLCLHERIWPREPQCFGLLVVVVDDDVAAMAALPAKPMVIRRYRQM